MSLRFYQVERGLLELWELWNGTDERAQTWVVGVAKIFSNLMSQAMSLPSKRHGCPEPPWKPPLSGEIADCESSEGGHSIHMSSIAAVRG